MKRQRFLHLAGLICCLIPAIFGPTSAQALSGRLAGAEEHVLALRDDGTVWAWGANGDGQLGDGTLGDRGRPVQVVDELGVPLQGIVAVAAGGWHSLALASDGSVWSWGKNDQGQLGAGSTFPLRTMAARVLGPGGSPLSGVARIECGRRFSLALGLDGSVWTWGDGNEGQLGDGEADDSPFAVRVRTTAGSLLTGVSAVAAGEHHGLALTLDGSVWSWGSDGKGQLGDDGSVRGVADLAVPVTREDGNPLTGIRLITAGREFGLAVDTDANLWAWGENDFGQHGNGSTEGTTQAKSWPLPPGLEDIVSFDAGDAHVSALTAAGFGWAWGSNGQAQLGGYPETQPHRSPSPLPILDSGGSPLGALTTVAVSDVSSFAVTDNSTVLSWGGSGRGILGRPETPVPPQGHYEPLPALDGEGNPFRLVRQISEHTLTLIKNGDGLGVVDAPGAGISCDASCTGDSATLVEGTQVTVSAAAAAGSVFIGFSGGGCSGDGPCELTLNESLTLVATFDPCRPSVGGDWNVTGSCEFLGQTEAPADVVIEPGVVLTVGPDAILEIDLHNHKLWVKEGGGVLVKDGGAIRQTSGTLQP